MIITREMHEQWLGDYLRKRYPELEPQETRAFDAYEKILRDNRITDELLRPIVESASSLRRVLSENAATYLAQLTVDHAEARAAVLAMSTDSRAEVRFSALISLGRRTPKEFVLDIVRRGLGDKSARVRAKAADETLGLRLNELVPELEIRLANEANQRVRDTLEFSLRLLRDGFIVEQSESGYSVTAPTDEGGVAGRWVSSQDFAAIGLEAIVKDLKVDRLASVAAVAQARLDAQD